MMLLVLGRDPFLIISNICFDLFIPPSPLTPLLLLGFHAVKLEALCSIHVGMWPLVLADCDARGAGAYLPGVCFKLIRSCWAQAGLKLRCWEGCWPCCSLLQFCLILITIDTKSICKRVWECIYIHSVYLHKHTVILWLVLKCGGFPYPHLCRERYMYYIQKCADLYTKKLILFSWFSLSNQVQLFSIIASPRKKDFIYLSNRM